MELHGDRVRLRSLTAGDADWVRAMLTEPSVAEWWLDTSAEMVQRDLIESGDGEWLAIEVDDLAVGIIGYEEDLDPQYRRAGIDVSLRSASQDRGMGTDAVRTLARWLIEQRGHHRITIDPAATNARAIACYSRVGFRAAGIMRRYESLPTGEYRDGLLMDLLAGELTPCAVREPS